MSKIKLIIQTTWQTEHFDKAASLLQSENIFFYFFCILSKWLVSFVFSPHPLPHDKGLWSFSVLVHVFTNGSIPSVLYAFIPGVGVGVGYSNMKLVYMCRAGYKNGRLRERPLAENWGLSERPLNGKTGYFGAKNNKETYIFLKTRVFSICSCQKSGTKNCTFLKRRSFGAAQVKK